MDTIHIWGRNLVIISFGPLHVAVITGRNQSLGILPLELW